MRFDEPRLAAAGDQYVLVSLGDDASLELNILTLDAELTLVMAMAPFRVGIAQPAHLEAT